VIKLRSRSPAGFKSWVARIATYTGTGVLAFSVWLAPVVNHYEVNRNGDANLTAWVTGSDGPRIDTMPTGSISLALNGPIFGGVNVAEKSARARPLVTALEIAQEFRAARLNYAQLRAKPDAPETTTAFASADTVNIVPPDRGFVTSTDRIAMAALPGAAAPAPGSAAAKALEAIAEVVAPDRDPAHPYPVEVPTQLAYVREAAPETVFKPNLRPAMRASRKQRTCLAEAIYFEARGESYRGQIAVAQVVRNRVESSVFPSTICAVVYQNKQKRNACQFSFACDGIKDRITERSAWAQAQEIADKVISGELYLPEVSNAINYHANYVRPRWAPRMNRITRIGAHIFYRFKRS